MNNHDLLLLLLGSFLPNNIFLWLFAKLRRSVHREEQKHNIHLINPRRYYQLFESDPHTQYRYHKRMQKFWLLNFLPMNVLVAIDIWAIVTGRTAISLLMTAILLAINTNYSLYANFDTETGDAHASYASIKVDEVQAGQTEEDVVPDEVDNIVEQLEAWSLPAAD